MDLDLVIADCNDYALLLFTSMILPSFFYLPTLYALITAPSSFASPGRLLHCPRPLQYVAMLSSQPQQQQYYSTTPCSKTHLHVYFSLRCHAASLAIRFLDKCCIYTCLARESWKHDD